MPGGRQQQLAGPCARQNSPVLLLTCAPFLLGSSGMLWLLRLCAASLACTLYWQFVPLKLEVLAFWDGFGSAAHDIPPACYVCPSSATRWAGL